MLYHDLLEKIRLLLALAGATLCSPSPLASAEVPTVKVNGNIRWVYDYDEGKRVARATGKPLFVVFRCER